MAEITVRFTMKPFEATFAVDGENEEEALDFLNNEPDFFSDDVLDAVEMEVTKGTYDEPEPDDNSGEVDDDD